MTYSGDGTPISTRVNISASSSSNTILRAGKQSAEYYVHNVILVAYDVVSGRISCVVLEDPRPMTRGKKAVAEVSFATHLIPRARLLGHAGIVISHCCWDRAKYDALSRLWQQWQQRERQHEDLERCDLSPEEAELLSWDVTTACAYHDIHSSL